MLPLTPDRLLALGIKPIGIGLAEVGYADGKVCPGRVFGHFFPAAYTQAGVEAEIAKIVTKGEGVLHLLASFTLTGHLTIPAVVHVDVEPQCYIYGGSAHRLTIEGTLEARAAYLFYRYSDYAVDWGVRQDHVFPEWFGYVSHAHASFGGITIVPDLAGDCSRHWVMTTASNAVLIDTPTGLSPGKPRNGCRATFVFEQGPTAGISISFAAAFRLFDAVPAGTSATEGQLLTVTFRYSADLDVWLQDSPFLGWA